MCLYNRSPEHAVEHFEVQAYNVFFTIEGSLERSQFTQAPSP